MSAIDHVKLERQRKIDAFLHDIAALQERHGVSLTQHYDEMYLCDADGNRISEYFELWEMPKSVDSYVEPPEQEGATRTEPLTREAANAAIEKAYADAIRNAFQTPSEGYGRLFK